MSTAVIIVAAGRGTRAATAASGLPKQYAMLGGRTVLARSVEAFARMPAVALVQVVVHADDTALYLEAVDQFDAKIAPPVAGGATRQASVLAGLEALVPRQPDLVLIHDAARPLVSRESIEAVLSALSVHQGAIAAVPLADTLKRAAATGTIVSTTDRTGLWRAQTPQGFDFEAILNAHRRAAAEGRSDFTDDAAIAEWAGLAVALVESTDRNFKITTPADLAEAERIIAVASETRIGSGFDVHRFTSGDHVWLGGVKIPHTHTLEGHSDADVVLHALTDAILGALGDGDIGQHFPPSDAKWKGAASRIFLEDASRRVRARGGHIVNVDITVLAEVPRVGPHRDAMKAAIGAVLGLATDRIGIKATTTEGLGFTGRREGIAAMASASVSLPPSP